MTAHWGVQVCQFALVPSFDMLGRRDDSFTDASKHEHCRPLLRSEGHVAFVYMADRASRIERVGIENLLIRFATRAAGRLIAWHCDDPDRLSAGAGTGRTRGAGRTS